MNDLYDKTTGYADLDRLAVDKLQTKITFVQQILENHAIPYAAPILVAGCGSGEEAVIIGDVFQVPTVGVDLNIPVEQSSFSVFCSLLKGDIGHLPFEDNTFGFAYSYHVLEHVPDHNHVLKELNRVLKPGSGLFIGFPNKRRLVAYISTHNEATLSERIRWNLRDYRKRLTGTFENHLGAHAGFTERGFISDAKRYFPQVIPVRNDYFFGKYPKYKAILNTLIFLRLNEFAFPSNYFLCLK
ncbi:class I SAM-dependent methyltransferase [Candidatus Neomarinimicrobiota bacterium]